MEAGLRGREGAIPIIMIQLRSIMMIVIMHDHPRDSDHHQCAKPAPAPARRLIIPVGLCLRLSH